MSRVYVSGIGAVSPAGWNVQAMRDALASKVELPVKEIPREGLHRPLRLRVVPSPATRPAFLSHPRLRRTSPIAHFSIASALEALGEDGVAMTRGEPLLGIVSCVATGCVIYCRRFFDEVLKDPATASPLVFPETVFNAPSSHLAAFLGTTAINYTLVGDPATYIQGLALGANWLLEERVDGVLVVGAEEGDWLTSDAFRRFSRDVVLAEGAGALYLTRQPRKSSAVELERVTDPMIFFDRQSRRGAAGQMRQQLGSAQATDLLCDGLVGARRLDDGEEEVWRDWPGQRLSPKRFLGEGLTAGVAWQCVAVVDALTRDESRRAVVSAVGCNESAVGAVFAKSSPGSSRGGSAS